MPLPHPIPYQGSKRRLAPRILAVLRGRRFHTLYEPFAGSAAITIAAAAAAVADRYELGETLAPLAHLWTGILTRPDAVADEYETVWTGQHGDPAAHYERVRAAYNAHGRPAHLLYLLARCVKNAPRFNRAGAFNQSADHRRAGMRPATMRANLQGAAALLTSSTSVRCADFEQALAAATPDDLVYLDPPWQGTSGGADTRYRDWPDRARLIEALRDLRARHVPYLLSYDGRHGAKTYGAPLPERAIGAIRLELDAGRSSQATLSGRAVTTYESLYVSRTLL